MNFAVVNPVAVQRGEWVCFWQTAKQHHRAPFPHQLYSLGLGRYDRVSADGCVCPSPACHLSHPRNHIIFRGVKHQVGVERLGHLSAYRRRLG